MRVCGLTLVRQLFRVVLVSVSLSSAYAADMRIESYDFTWHVGNADGVKFDLVKTEDSIRVALARPEALGQVASISVPNAAAMSSAMRSAILEVGRAPPNAAPKTINVGTNKVMYWRAEDGGARIAISAAEGLFGIDLKPAQAETIAAWLAQTEELSNHLTASMHVP